MKKLIMLICLMHIFFSLYSQNSGFKAGLNISGLVGSRNEVKSKFGFALGYFASLEISETFFIQPEMFFSMKGAKEKVEIYGENYTISYNLNYIEIPILVKIIQPSTKLNPSILIGPAFSMNVASYTKMDGESFDTNNGTSKIDVGVIFGGNLDFEKVILDARINMGLSNVYEMPDSKNVSNFTFSILIGYRI